MLAPVAPSPSPGVVALSAAAAGLLIAALPRAGWMAAAAGLMAALAASGLSGLALLGLAATAPTALLLPRDERLWSAPAGAPLIAIAGAALAWPSLAGQAATVRVRAALGGLGLWWCLLAEQTSGRTLLLGALPGAPQVSVWQGSADDALREVLWPLVQSGAPLLALPWAVGRGGSSAARAGSLAGCRHRRRECVGRWPRGRDLDHRRDDRVARRAGRRARDGVRGAGRGGDRPAGGRPASATERRRPSVAWSRCTDLRSGRDCNPP